MRRSKSCGAVDVIVGWPGGHELTMDECDECWRAGKGVGAESLDWRTQYVAKVLGNVAASIETQTALTIDTMLARHIKAPNARAAAILKAAKRLGRGKALDAALKYAPQVVDDVKILFASMTQTEIADAADPHVSWEPHRPNWAEIERQIAAGDHEVKQPGLFGTLRSFGRAMWSSRGGRVAVDWDTWNTRHISCFGKDLNGTRHKEPCPNLTKSPKGFHFCNACWCGESEIARLDGEAGSANGLFGRVFGWLIRWLFGRRGFTKLQHPDLTCPRSMPGFAELTVSAPHAKSIAKSREPGRAEVARVSV